VSGTGSSRALSDVFLKWGRRRGPEQSVAPAPSLADDEQIVPTKAFKKFLSCLSGRTSRVILDLGPVVGANVSFFGEELGCKILVEDLYAELERAHREDRVAGFAELMAKRFRQGDGSIDGILVWDFLDYLDRPAAQVLCKELTRLLAPGGAVLGFFATIENPAEAFTRFTIVDDQSLRTRSYLSRCRRQRVLANRDIARLFEGLTVAESFLLLNKTREMLFRKPSASRSEPARESG